MAAERSRRPAHHLRERRGHRVRAVLRPLRVRGLRRAPRRTRATWPISRASELPSFAEALQRRAGAVRQPVAHAVPLRDGAAPGADRRRRPPRLPLPHRVPSAAAQARPAEVPGRPRDRRRQLPLRHVAGGQGGRAARRCPTSTTWPDERGHRWTRARSFAADPRACTRRSARRWWPHASAPPRRRWPRSPRRRRATPSTPSTALARSAWSSSSPARSRRWAPMRAGRRRPARRPGRPAPRPRPRTRRRWRVIVDPIDGTRGLMYQKRSAWILTGVAPNRGPGTSLRGHRARGADGDPAGQAAPLGRALGRARRGRRRGALQPPDRRVARRLACAPRRRRPSPTASP